jgi:hypothetical protein
MTTVREIINSINFDDKRIQTSPDWEKLSSQFGIYNLYWSEDTRLKAYHVKTWLCTDTWVGWVAYFLDSEFVCLSTQNARKSDTEFEFVSKEAHSKLRDYLFSLVDDGSNEIDILDLDEEVSDKYTIAYNSQILHKTAWYLGEKVKIKKTIFPYNDRDRYFHIVEIEYEDGVIEEVNCTYLKFEYNNLD